MQWEVRFHGIYDTYVQFILIYYSHRLKSIHAFVFRSAPELTLN